MGQAEIADNAKQLGEAVPTREQFLKDPAMQERFFERYTLAHHQYLMKHNDKYAAMSAEDKAAALAYAHNQGAGGASQWINTGMVGKDAFGTAGTRYSQAVHTAFARAPQAGPPRQVARRKPRRSTSPVAPAVRTPLRPRHANRARLGRREYPAARLPGGHAHDGLD